MANTTIDEIIEQVTTICRNHGVEQLMLFGSYAKGTNTDNSDVDFVIKGFEGDMSELQEAVDEIRTLKKIDLFHYESIYNDFLLEDINKYGRQIY
ncbi:MAG: nucleotidyltransferase domain-containing protein [Pseudobutyrivibrio sp.]|nr:nucleotidyltransferase domain-containing protein [Pseudobutyrivibrio sp.]